MWTIRRHVLPILLASAALLAGCTEGKLVVDQAKVITNPGPAKPAPYKIGKPYQVNGVWYYPKADYRYSETGIASWYGPGFHGKRTATGEVYDENGLTAAHKTLPMPSMVRVTNLEKGRPIQVRANDRGPIEAERGNDVLEQLLPAKQWQGTNVEVLEGDQIESIERGRQLHGCAADFHCRRQSTALLQSRKAR
jgi:rare lipoprotein A